MPEAHPGLGHGRALPSILVVRPHPERYGVGDNVGDNDGDNVGEPSTTSDRMAEPARSGHGGPNLNLTFRQSTGGAATTTNDVRVAVVIVPNSVHADALESEQ